MTCPQFFVAPSKDSFCCYSKTFCRSLSSAAGFLSSLIKVLKELRCMFPSFPCPTIAGIFSSVIKFQIDHRCIFPSAPFSVFVEKIVINHKQQHKAPEDDPCRYMFQVENNTDADQQQLR